MPKNTLEKEVIIECNNCNQVHKIICLYKTFRKLISDPLWCPACQIELKEDSFYTKEQWKEQIKKRLEFLNNGKDWRKFYRENETRSKEQLISYTKEEIILLENSLCQ